MGIHCRSRRDVLIENETLGEPLKMPYMGREYLYMRWTCGDLCLTTSSWRNAETVMILHEIQSYPGELDLQKTASS